MTRDDIIAMAREAGWIIRDDLHYMDHQAMQDALVERIERFAALVTKHTLANIDPSSFMSWQEGYAAGAAAERNRTWTQDRWTEYERSIAAAEREACAKACEDYWQIDGTDTALAFAATVRARGETK